ncbi:hypothetical protein AcV7_010087 [Taiwanofungus camphoratus]|nr:hypothetical protein AcV7_010087 [Antrodia cinnamomea]
MRSAAVPPPPLARLRDDYRPPDGIAWAGYDADTGWHYFHGIYGSLWEGGMGARYGRVECGASAV